jgi:DNA-binding MarR family transcriptional regulator
VINSFGGPGPTPLPDPQVVRQMIANRQARSRFFDAALFGDPVWDMLLDLTAAHGEGAQVSVTSLCIAAGVPATTALRWLTQMVESGIFVRVPDPVDRRRAFIALSQKGLAGMSGYFASLRTTALHAA